jgi:hypothetical protein
MSPQHKPVLGLALAFIALFGALTVFDMIENGPNFLSLVSAVVLAMFAFGIVGALRQPPDR